MRLELIEQGKSIWEFSNDSLRGEHLSWWRCPSIATRDTRGCSESDTKPAAKAAILLTAPAKRSFRRQEQVRKEYTPVPRKQDTYTVRDYTLMASIILLNTKHSRVSLEKLTDTREVKKLFIFRTRRPIVYFTKLHHISLRTILILCQSFRLCLGLPSYRLSSGFLTKN